MVQLLERFQSLIGIVVSVLLTLWVFRKNRIKDEKTAARDFATHWRVVLEELWFALDRMHEANRLLAGNRIPNSEVFLHPSISESFFEDCKDLAAACDALYIYQNLHQFAWNMNTIQQLKIGKSTAGDGNAIYHAETAIERHINSAKWFIRARHHKMVTNLQKCDERYRAFCNKWCIEGGAALGPLNTLQVSERIDEDVAHN